MGRTQMTKFIDDGSVGACAHLIEVAEKSLKTALAVRVDVNRAIKKARGEIQRAKTKLREHAHGR